MNALPLEARPVTDQLPPKMPGTSSRVIWTRPFALLWAFNFLTFLAAFQLFPTAPLQLRALGASLAESGRFMALFTAGSSLGALLTGSLGDRLGHRRTMVGSAALFTVIFALYAILNSRQGMYLLAPLHGAVWSALLTSTAALLGGVLPTEKRAERMSIFGLSSPFGVMIGPSVGVWLFQHLGFRTLCLSIAASFGVLSLIARTLPPGDAHAGQHRGHLILPERRVLRLCGVLFFLAFGWGVLSSYSTQEAVALKLAWPSAFLSCLALGMFGMRLVMVRVGFGERPTRLLPGMTLVAMIGLLLLALLPGPAIVRHMLSAVIYGAGYSMIHTLVNTALLESTEPHRRGSAFGSFLFAFDSGIGLGSWLLGMLIGWAGFRAGWGAAAALLAGSWFLSLRVISERG